MLLLLSLTSCDRFSVSFLNPPQKKRLAGLSAGLVVCECFCVSRICQGGGEGGPARHVERELHAVERRRKSERRRRLWGETCRKKKKEWGRDKARAYLGDTVCVRLELLFWLMNIRVCMTAYVFLQLDGKGTISRWFWSLLRSPGIWVWPGLARSSIFGVGLSNLVSSL
jgi:hypothetical protein